MKLTFGFGTDMQEVEVPERNLIGELHANDVPLGLTGEAEVIRALREPIGAPRLKDIVRPGERIAIVTSDITRPMPTAKVMGMGRVMSMRAESGRRTSPWSLRWAAIVAKQTRSIGSWPESVPILRSSAWTATPTTASLTARPPGAPPWTSPGS